MSRRLTKREHAIVEKWLWWATFLVALESGSGPLTAYRRAQRETAKLNA